MKTNCEHPYIPICRIVNSILLIFLLSVSGLFSATWNIEEGHTSFVYKWEINQQDLTEFVKTGNLINSGISGSIFFQGRYYPVYTSFLKNTVSQLAYRIKNKTLQEYELPILHTDYGKINDQAIDEIDITNFNEFVRLLEVPGLGTLVEIMPLLPQADGHILCLSQADIELFSTQNVNLEKADLKKETINLAKAMTSRQALPSQFCDLCIHKPGVYEVSGQDLIDRGVDIEQIIPTQLKLFYWGSEIPCRVTITNVAGREAFKENNVIQFFIKELINPYGDYKFNPFTDYDVVQLNWASGIGKRYVQESSEISQDQNKFTPDMNRKFRSTIHVEKNEQYQPLSRLHEEELSHINEHSFYNPSIKVGRNVTFPFELWDPVTDSPYGVDFTLRMQGLTYSVDDEMDHQIIVRVNDQQLLEDEWEGQLPKISTNEGSFYSHSNLLDGENTIEIAVKGFPDNSFIEDLVLFDWLDISYDRYMIAHNNRLIFSPQHGPGTYLFQVKGLTSASDVIILKNGTNWIRGYKVAKEVNDGQESFSIYFEDQCDGDEVYLIAGRGNSDIPDFGVESIDSIRYVDVMENQYYSARPDGDYIIITHKDFYEKSLELVAHKESMGYTPVVYELERLYDEYNNGNESPYAIKEFLKDVYTNWQTRPRFVLLIGDTGTKNALPIIKYQSSGAIGAIIAENWFVDIDDDFVLEMALGRLPVSEVDELDSIIVKIKNYDLMKNPRQANRFAILTGPGSVFRSQAQTYLNTISPDNTQTDRVYLYDTDETGEFNAGINSTDSLLKFMNDGILAINYIGHGGGYTWDNHVFPYEAFDQLNPGNPFIVNSMTCFSNTFSNSNAIGEMFVRHPRGSVSVLASTGYGWINSNYYLFEKVMYHMNYDKMSHGEALQYSLVDYFFSTFGKNASFIDQIDDIAYVKYFRKSLFYQFCILGDPSASFPVLKNETIHIAPQSISAGINVNLQLEHPDITHAYMDIVGVKDEDRKHPVRQKMDLDVLDGQANFSLGSIPPDMKSGLLQLTLWDDEKNMYTGTTPLAFNAPFVENIRFYPNQPGLLDTPVSLRLDIDSQESIDSVLLGVYNKRSYNSSYQTIRLNTISPGHYESDDQFIFLSKSQFYAVADDTTIDRQNFYGNYFMPIIFQGNDIIKGDFNPLYPIVPENKDISIVDFSVENGKSKLVLFNQADTSVWVKVNITVDTENLSYSFEDTVLSIFDVDGQYETTGDHINAYYFDVLPKYGKDSIEVLITPLGIVDTDTSNNLGKFEIENNWISSHDGHFINYSSDTCLFQNAGFDYIIAKNTILQQTSIYLGADSTIFDLSSFGAQQIGHHKLYVSSEEPFDLWGAVPTAILTENKLLAYYNEQNRVFYKIHQTQVDSLTLFPMNKSGYYLLAQATENTGPQIELNINAREILERAYISERSDFSVVLRDNYGINPLPDFWSILLDGEEVSENNISLVEGESIKELGINFKLDLDVGDHTLQVTAQDLVGNQTETDVYEVVYTGESQLIDYGNFPNPFSTKTTFIYELTEQFDDIVIKIYTVSGRKIYSMSLSENALTDLPLHSIGYHEIPWNGIDEFGNSVANGVYFYVIEGKVDGKTIKSTGKVAKLWL